MPERSPPPPAALPGTKPTSSPSPPAALPGAKPTSSSPSVPAAVAEMKPTSSSPSLPAALPGAKPTSSSPFIPAAVTGVGPTSSSPSLPAAPAPAAGAPAPTTSTAAPAPGSAEEKLAQLNEKLRGAAVLELFNIKGKPAPDLLVRRVAELREVVGQLCAHLAPDDAVRATALERLRGVERLVEDPLEWHILVRAQELKQDGADPAVRLAIEQGFFEEHVPRAVWLSAPPDGNRADSGGAELRKSMRLPVLAEVELDFGVVGGVVVGGVVGGGGGGGAGGGVGGVGGVGGAGGAGGGGVGGGWTRLRTENLSRDGLCICDIPAAFDESAAAKAKSLQLRLHLTSPERVLPLTAQVVWRHGPRLGVAFALTAQEQSVIDTALQNHFLMLRAVVDRWLQLTPKHPGAIACSALVAFYASALGSNRQAALDKLVAAADEQPNAGELQLAVAKLRLELNDVAGSAVAFNRAARALPHDPRVVALCDALANRGSGVVASVPGARRRNWRAKLAQSAPEARAALAAALVLVLAGAVVFAVLELGGPREAARVPSGGMPCASVELLDENALCHIDPGRFRALTADERMRLADHTMSALSGRGVRQLTVYSLTGEGVLDIFQLPPPPPP